MKPWHDLFPKEIQGGNNFVVVDRFGDLLGLFVGFVDIDVTAENEIIRIGNLNILFL